MADDELPDHAGEAARRAVDGVMTGPPGPDSLAAALAVVSEDEAPCSARRLVEACVALRAVENLCAAARLAATVRLDQVLQPDPGTRPGPLPPGRRAADELAAAWGVAPGAASRWVTLARRSESHLPAAVDAMAEGRLDLTQLKVLAEVTRDLPDAAVRAVEAMAVQRGAGCPVARLRGDLAAEAQRCDPGYAARAAATGRSERDVVVQSSPLPGCRRLVADLPTVAAQAAWTAVDAAATVARDRRLRGDGTAEERTIGQLRADLLTALLTGAQDPADPSLVPTPTQLRSLAEVQVVVAADVLGWAGGGGPPPGGWDGLAQQSSAGSAVGRVAGRLGGDARGAGASRARAVAPSTGPAPTSATPPGRDDGAAAEDTGGTVRACLPGWVPAAGPVDLSEARALAAATRWRRLVVDPGSGTLLAYGARSHPPPDAGRQARDDPAALADDPRWLALLTDPPEPPCTGSEGRYVPPPALRRHVHTRDATCLGPSCHHTARGTELDHTVPFGQRDDDGAEGTTRADNLGSLCRRAHNAKTHGGWTLRQGDEGDFSWTSPTGRHYRREGRPLLPGWRG